MSITPQRPGTVDRIPATIFVAWASPLREMCFGGSGRSSRSWVRLMGPLGRPCKFVGGASDLEAEMIELLLPHMLERSKRFQSADDANEAVGFKVCRPLAPQMPLSFPGVGRSCTEAAGSRANRGCNSIDHHPEGRQVGLRTSPP